jgi:transcriptional regulator with GAF, ATPase, and Fis domain
MQPSKPKIWLEHAGDVSAFVAIRDGLQASGLEVRAIEARDADSDGIFFVGRLTDRLLSDMKELSRTSRGRIIALISSTSASTRAESWRLLSAGVSEVLVWDSGPDVLRRISALVQRWAEIRQLANSREVRQMLIGSSAEYLALVRRVVEAAAYTDLPILLIGESGTGKELLARLVQMLDRRSARNSSAQLITVDCTTLAPELSGSELFGHEKGAYTGAAASRDGAFALANGGTLFLDEVGELPLALQAQLLRAVQERTFKRIGGNVWNTTDFRLVCATNRDLTEEIRNGGFRGDLYYRIAGWVFRTLPLAERRDDILPLAEHFYGQIHKETASPVFDGAVCEYLLNRAYPGNVRELRQLVQRIAYRHVGPGPVTPGDIPEEDRPPAEQIPCWPDEDLERSVSRAIALGAGLKEISQAASSVAIRMAVQSEHGNLQRAAKRLGVTDRALQIRRASGQL